MYNKKSTFYVKNIKINKNKNQNILSKVKFSAYREGKQLKSLPIGLCLWTLWLF